MTQGKRKSSAIAPKEREDNGRKPGVTNVKKKNQRKKTEAGFTT